MANEILERSEIPRSFCKAGMKSGIPMISIKVSNPSSDSNGLPQSITERVISAEMFLREFDRIATPAIRKSFNIEESDEPLPSSRNNTTTSASSTRGATVATITHETKKKVQGELREVLKGIEALNSKLIDQLNELEHKGWNDATGTAPTLFSSSA